MPWADSLDYIAYVREHGVAQFLSIYNKVKDVTGEELLWAYPVHKGAAAVSAPSADEAVQGKVHLGSV